MKRIRKRIMPVVLALVMMIGLIPIMPEKVEAAASTISRAYGRGGTIYVEYGSGDKITFEEKQAIYIGNTRYQAYIDVDSSTFKLYITLPRDCRSQSLAMLDYGSAEIPVSVNGSSMKIIAIFEYCEQNFSPTSNENCYTGGKFLQSKHIPITKIRSSVPGYNGLVSAIGCGIIRFKEHRTAEVNIPQTCTSAGYTQYSCEDCGEVIKFDEKPARGHSYNTATYTWNSAHTACTGSRTCKYHDSTLTANAVVTSAITTQPTCTTEGIRTYTATFSDANYATQTYTEAVSRTGHKSVSANNAMAATCTTAGKRSDEKCAVCGVTLKTGATIPATGHSYGTPTYKWSRDGKRCKAERVCAKDSSHKETEDATITSTVKTAATCTTEGVTTNTATFKNPAFAKQTKDVVTSATGHKWGTPEYVWSDDNKSCTAKVVCVDDSAHTDSETVETTSKTTDATCTDDGNTVYTADFKRIGETQTKTVNIPAVGHKYESTVVAPTILEDGYTEHTCTVCNNSYKDNYTDKIAIKSDSIVCKPFKTPVLTKADDRSLSLTDKNVEVVDADGIEHVIGLKEAAKAGIIEDNVIIKDLDSETEESVKITDKDSITIKVPNFQFVITTADGIQHSSEPGRFTREDTSVKSLTLNGQDLNTTEDGFNLQLPCTTNLEDIKDVDFNITLSDVASSYSIEGSNGNYQLTVTAEEPTITKSYSIIVTNDKHDLIDTVVAPSLGKQGYTEHKCKYCNYESKDNYVDAIEADPETLNTSNKCKVIYTEDGRIPSSIILISFVGTDGKTYDISIKDAYDLGILGDSKIGYYVGDEFFEYNGEDYINKVDNMRFVIKKSSDGVIEELELPSMRKARQDVSLESVTYKGNILEQNDDTFNYTAACNESKAIAVNNFNVTTSDSEALATIERVSDGQYAIHVIAEDPAYTKDYLISVGRQPHQYNKNVVGPTCKAKGYTEYTCAVCGDAYRDDVKDIVDHIYIRKRQ